MSMLIRGGAVIAMQPDKDVITQADIAIVDGIIIAVGEAPGGFAPDETVDATQHIIMPGLFNAHLHSGTVYSRGCLPYDGLDPWFDLRATQDGQVQRAISSSLEAEDAYWAALLTAAELIRGGVVGFADQYFFMDAVARAVLESGLRAKLSWCTFGEEDGEIGGDITAVAAFAEKWQAAAEGRIKTSLGPHSPYLCSPQFLARTAAVAARLGTGIHLHVAESQEQVDFSLLAYDMTPIEVLDKHGVLDVPVVAANAAYLNDLDIAILAARGACVVACPSAQRAAGLAQTPIDALRAARVSVGLGTDGAGLAGSLDMFGAVRDAGAGLRGEFAQRAEALRLATWGGAQVLGFTNSGQVAPGFSADLILINSRRPHLWPMIDPLGAILTSVRSGDITDVMVNGKWLLRKGALTTIDEERVLAETAARARRLHRALPVEPGLLPSVPRRNNSDFFDS